MILVIKVPSDLIGVVIVVVFALVFVFVFWLIFIVWLVFVFWSVRCRDDGTQLIIGEEGSIWSNWGGTTSYNWAAH